MTYPRKTGELIDVMALCKSVSTTSSGTGVSLQQILEDPSSSTCVWDVRNDADALWALYQVRLAGVVDIQLLENASRSTNKTHVRGLAKCIQYDLKLGFTERQRWTQVKNDVQNMMNDDIFSIRPIDDKVLQYCVNDVTYLPLLHTLYSKRLNNHWLTKVKEESELRVTGSLAPTYDPQGPSKRFGPWGAGIYDGKPMLTLDDLWNAGEDDLWNA